MAELPDRAAAVAGSPNDHVRIYNKSTQIIPIQVSKPGGDFYMSEQQLHIMPGRYATVNKSLVRLEQLDNLKKSGMIAVIYDSEDNQ